MDADADADADAEYCKLCLVCGFLAMEPVNSLVIFARKLGGGLITEEVQYIIYNECINNKVFSSYSPSKLYLMNFLKRVILEVESQSMEVLDILYDCYAEYLVHLKNGSLSESTGKCYRILTFMFPANKNSASAFHDGKIVSERNNLTLTLRCSPNMLEGDTGCFIWPSSILLSEFVLCHPELFSGKRCFEVGSGVGLVGMCLAFVKASKVILTDGDLATLSNMKHNMETNRILVLDNNGENAKDVFVECRFLPWESASIHELEFSGAEIILGADVIYDPSSVRHLVQVLAALVGTVAGNRNRRRRSFVKEMKHSQESQSCEHKSQTVGGGSSKKDPTDKHSNIYLNESYPVAYLATVHRNIDTFNYFSESAFDAGLAVTEITQHLRCQNLLPYLSGFDRSSVHLYKISSLTTLQRQTSVA